MGSQTLVISAAAALLWSACASAQAQFDVASVKPMNLTGEGSRRENVTVDPVSVTLRNVTLSSALQWAYNVKEYQVTGPGWIKDYRYEISAKSATPTSEDQMRKMLQALLADRFKVTLHHETKDLTVYALTVAKGGLKMAPADPGSQFEFQRGGGTTLGAKAASIGDIADLLSQASRAIPDVPPVVDRTGLTGRYNLSIDAGEFMQSVQAEFQKGPPDPSALVSVVQEILEKQLGLHSDLRKVRMDMLVIDHADSMPIGN